jgi:chaperonin GroEL
VMNPRIFVTDHALESPEHLLPAVEACLAAGERSLLVIAPEIRDAAVALLVVNRRQGVLDGALAVRAPSVGAQRARILEDIAVQTGGRCIRQEPGERLEDVTLDDLGRARQAWATRTAFGILGGQGSKEAIRRRIGEARAELSGVGDDPYLREKIRERIGKLAGAAAHIRVGAPTAASQAELKLRVEAALTAARLALRDGVVPGGGAALLACVPALEALEPDGDEGVGVGVLAAALAEPMRAIAENAGFEPGAIVHEARRRGSGWTFDAVRRAWVDARLDGPVDPLSVTLTALETSVSAATMALTTDVLVRRGAPAYR